MDASITGRRWALSVCGLLWLLTFSCATTAAADGQLLRDVSFDRYADYSGYSELVRRLLSPAAALRLGYKMQATGSRLAGQPVDLAAEKFIVYVPSRKPEHGYALLVFVPPWQDARLPDRWAAVLEQMGVIFVSAARSGNDESPMGRREPLALLAATNIMGQYPVDPERVLVGGFSGGSRIALRLALGYPDLFRGALLNAGSDAIGNPASDAPVPLPPRELLFRFQESTHIVYATGERDAEHIDDDLTSTQSLRQWCMYDSDDIVMPRVGHTVADAVTLSRALTSLFAAAPPDHDRLARCRAAIDAELAGKFARIESLIAGGQRAAADKLLDKLDRQYGGLAAPRSLELPPPL